MHSFFRSFAERTSGIVASPWAFLLAAIVVIVWAVTGPVFNYSDTWQLVINTGTTIVTFLMVFLIQNTQNRDSRALHLKLDELLRGVEGARTNLVDLEDLTDDELERLHEEFHRLHETAPRRRAAGLRSASEELNEVSQDLQHPDASEHLEDASDHVAAASEHLEREAVRSSRSRS